MKAKDLKNSILQMAVEGKLVPQDPNDEPASVLLERIRGEKHKLIAEGKAKFPKGGESIIYIGSDGSPYEKRVDAKGRVLSNECIADNLPFEELPKGWAWARLGNLLSLVSDGAHKTPQYTESGVLFLSVQNVSGGSFDLTKVRHVSQETHEELCKRAKPSRGDILLCRIGTLGKPIIVDVDYEFSIFVSLGLLRPILTAIAKWICSCIDSPIGFAWIESVKVGGGTHTFKINLGDIPDFILPVPPLAEQRRIVERVNELMPLVEEYERLDDAREALDAALPSRLRKSVLQMAVQGKLVPQDPADEPASVLLERIRCQRRQLITEKKMKVPRGGESIIFAGSDGRRYEKRVDARGRESDPVCIDDEIPFEIPEGWEWARLESVTTYIQRGKSPKYSTVEKYPVIAQKCNQWSGFSVEKARFIDPATVSKYADERILKDGDLLWNSTGLGTLGRMAVYDSAKNRYGWAVADSHVTVIRTREDWLDHRFAFAYFAGPSVQSVIEDQASGSTKQKELAQETVRNYLIPVPPLAEQRRIVYEVDRLFKILA